MRTIAATFLTLISVFTGGCSVVFIFMGFAKSAAIIIFPSLLIAGLAGWGAAALSAAPPPTPNTNPPIRPASDATGQTDKDTPR